MLTTDGQEGGLSPRRLLALSSTAPPRSHHVGVREVWEPAPATRKGKFREDLSKPISLSTVAFLALIDREHSCPRGGAGGTAVCCNSASGRKGCQKKKARAVGTKYMTP